MKLMAPELILNSTLKNTLGPAKLEKTLPNVAMLFFCDDA